MEPTLNLNIPLSFNQLLEAIKRLPLVEKERLITALKEDSLEETSKTEILENLAADYTALKQGSLKTRPLKDVLNEL